MIGWYYNQTKLLIKDLELYVISWKLEGTNGQAVNHKSTTPNRMYPTETLYTFLRRPLKKERPFNDIFHMIAYFNAIPIHFEMYH